MQATPGHNVPDGFFGLARTGLFLWIGVAAWLM